MKSNFFGRSTGRSGLVPSGSCPQKRRRAGTILKCLAHRRLRNQHRSKRHWHSRQPVSDRKLYYPGAFPDCCASTKWTEARSRAKVLSKRLIVLVTIPVCLLLFIAGGPEPVFLPLVQEAPALFGFFQTYLHGGFLGLS
jgi:hypothetical protein